MSELGAIGCFLLGMLATAASIGFVGGLAFAWWRKHGKEERFLCAIAVGILRGLSGLPKRPLGVLIPVGVDAMAVDFAQFAVALENRDFYYTPIAVVPPAAPPGGWHADDVGERPQ